MLPKFSVLITRPVQLLALGFGSGLSPKAPGTVGSLAALPFFFLLLPLPVWVYIAILVVSFLVGVYLCEQTATALGVHDHPAIVWDEFVGLWLALLPLVVTEFTWWGVVAGFVLFRFFDIVKPWPIRYLDQHVHGGLGIMVDDVLAGVFAAIILWLLIGLF